MQNFDSYRVIYSSYKSNATHEWLSTEYITDFYAANNQMAIAAVLDIGEEIYSLADIAFHNAILYNTTDKVWKEIFSADYNAAEIYE